MRPIARYGFLGNVRKLLSQATFFIDAKEATVGQTATNLGTGGAVLDAQYGSTTGSDTNDPLLLEHDGTNYLYLPGVAGNYASTPDAAALDITGDIEVVARVAMDDWKQSSGPALIGKWGGASQRSWWLQLVSTGVFNFIWTPDGTFASRIEVQSTVANSFTNGTAYWLKVTLDVVDGANKTVRFYYANDQATEPTSWTQLGADVTSAGNTSIFAGTDALTIGQVADVLHAAGKFYRAIIRNGIGGTVVFDADFTTGITSGGQTTFTESSSNAATVTINRSTSGRKSVAVVRDVWLFGTDDYLEVADNDLLDFGASDDFTVVWVGRQWATPANYGRYIDKSDSFNLGWSLQSNGTNAEVFAGIDDGPNQAFKFDQAFTLGQITCFGMRVDRAAQTLQSFVNGTLSSTVSTASVGSLVNALPMRIGRDAGAGIPAYIASELLGVAIFRRALSADEITSIANYYSAS